MARARLVVRDRARRRLPVVRSALRSRRAARARDRRRPDRAVPRARRPPAWSPGAHAARRHLGGLVEKFGVDPDRVRGMESDDLAWLRAGEGEGHFHGPGAWPFGINAYAGREDNDLILWLPSINAIVTGDSLSNFGDGLDIQLGGRTHVTRDDVVRRLRPLLDLPVELVLPAHGEPTDRATLERVLS